MLNSFFTQVFRGGIDTPTFRTSDCDPYKTHLEAGFSVWLSPTAVAKTSLQIFSQTLISGVPILRF